MIGITDTLRSNLVIITAVLMALPTATFAPPKMLPAAEPSRSLAATQPSQPVPAAARLPKPEPPASSSRSRGVIKIPFQFVNGWMVCNLPSSKGPLRLVFDTGANATELRGKSEPIELRLGSQDVRLVPAALETSVLDHVNTLLAPRRRLNGILGQDVMDRYRRVTIDYVHLQIEFEP
jgi:hypothetical protein